MISMSASRDLPGSFGLSGLPTVSTTDPATRGNCLEDEVVALFDRFRDPLLRYLSSFGLGFSDGEDIIQDVFLSLFQHLQCGKSRDNLGGWLFRVAHNLALKRRDRARRDLDARAEAGIEDLASDPGPSPEDGLVSSQTQERMMAVVHALREQDRRCLCLRAEGLRYREIAELLHMSLGAVSLSLTRSLARVARSVERSNL
jgi:RNA polymerase sigma-70 factor, ECF subfamily